MAGILKTMIPKSVAVLRDQALAEASEITADTRRYCDEARREAATLLEAAKLEAIEIRQRAAADGLLAGRAEAEQEVRAAVQRHLAEAPATWASVLQAVQRSRQEWLARWEREALDLSVAIAERLIRREVQQQPEITLDLIRETLQLAAGRNRCQLALHPSDLELLSEQLRQLQSDLGKSVAVELIADGRMERGSCRLHTEFGVIDQQWTTQIARVLEELR
ncbi:MAG: FliH/SctL family protein [Planctomycetota bacterium]